MTIDAFAVFSWANCSSSSILINSSVDPGAHTQIDSCSALPKGYMKCEKLSFFMVSIIFSIDGVKIRIPLICCELISP